jgi:hypothetical protein
VKPCAYTPNVSITDAVWPPEVPVTVIEYCPRLAALLAENVSVLFPVAGFGVKEAVTPLGKPDADKLTFPLNPYCG